MWLKHGTDGLTDGRIAASFNAPTLLVEVGIIIRKIWEVESTFCRLCHEKL